MWYVSKVDTYSILFSSQKQNQDYNLKKKISSNRRIILDQM